MLKSQDPYDWLLVGWKYESIEAPKDELLEETLNTRYFSYLNQTFLDFVMCAKKDEIERIEGSATRHIVHASALNYGAHHGDVPFDKINITLTDTPEHAVKINKVIKQKSFWKRSLYKM